MFEDFDYILCNMEACRRSVGLMDKALAPGAGDSRFESWAGHFFVFIQKDSILDSVSCQDYVAVAKAMYCVLLSRTHVFRLFKFATRPGGEGVGFWNQRLQVQVLLGWSCLTAFGVKKGVSSKPVAAQSAGARAIQPQRQNKSRSWLDGARDVRGKACSCPRPVAVGPCVTTSPLWRMAT